MHQGKTGSEISERGNGILSQVQLDDMSSAPETRPIVEIKNLKVFFSQGRGFFTRYVNVIKAVNNVSFKIESSEIVSLVGESGSGKTTIGRCIAGLASVNSGSIKYGGIEVTLLRGKNLHRYHRDVQMIFQDPYASLNPRRDVLTAISIPIRRLNGEKEKSKIKDQVKNLLAEVGLDPEVMNKLPHQLSGGERQRVNIARGLASNPKLLVADEPTTMLDASQRLNILVLLEQLRKKRNLTVLLITHDLASAKRMGGKTAILYKGELVEFGPTNLLLSLPHHPYTELLINSSPKLDFSKSRYSETMETVKEQHMNAGCIFRTRCRYATDICEKVEPEFLEKPGSRFVACHNALNSQRS